MTPYKNLSGNSGVVAYEVGDSFIHVKFQNDRAYAYTFRRPGAAEVRHMKTLARTGRGLATFISQVVKERYDRELSPPPQLGIR